MGTVLTGSMTPQAESSSLDILIVEDNAALAEMYELALGGAGWSVAKALTLDQGWQLTTTARPRLILLDINLGADNGLDLLDRLGDVWPDPQERPCVVVFTNLGGREHRERAESAGAIAYLVKANTRLGDLVERVRALLDMAESPCEALA